MERREFIQRLIIRGGIAVALPSLIIQSCEKGNLNDLLPGNSNTLPSDLKLDLEDPKYTALQTVGGYVNLTSYNLIVIKTGNNEFAALSNICTHQGCKVSYNKNSNTLPCPCHGSVFSISGSVLHGPASSPLRVYNTSLEGNILTISS